MLTKEEILNALEQMGAKPNHKLGQNFLLDENVVKKAISAAQIESGETIVEVGPGLGALTQELMATGAKLTSIEMDRAYAKRLRSLYPSLTIIEGDAVKVDYTQFGEFKIVSNLPYAVSTPLLDGFSQALPSVVVVLVQKELAQRYMATSGKPFSALSVFLQSAYTLKVIQRIAPSSFFPAPAVDSVLLEMRRKADPVRFTPKARKLVRSLFLNRRKQLHKAAKANPTTAAWLEQLVQEGKVTATVRAEEMPLELWARLASVE